MFAKVRSQFQRLFSLRKAIALVWKSTPQLTIANILLAIAQSGLPLLSLYLTKLIIDRITETASSPEPSFQPIVILIALAAIVALLSDALRAIAGWVNEAQSQRVTDYVQSLLHSKSIEMDLEYYENPQYYDFLHQAQSEAIYRPNLIFSQLIQLVNSSLSLAGIGLLLFSLDWAIALLLIIAAIPVFFVRLNYSQQLYQQWQQWTSSERMAHYYNYLITQSPHAKEIRLFNLGKLFQRRFDFLRKQIRQERLSLFARRSFAETCTQSSATIAVFVALGLIAARVLANTITIGSLVMYYQAFQRGQTLLRESLSHLANLYENSLFLSNFYQFLSLKPKVIDPKYPAILPDPLQGKLEFRHVSFAYPQSQRTVLADINITIEPSQTIAIVGENGAGKTTLIKLISRLYAPTSGEIFLDGINLNEFSLTELRQQIAIIFQDYARYHLTVQENIGIGDIEEWDDRNKIEQAAEFAQLEKTIAKLPQNYDTILGKEFIDGEELSIGEWQKIAIARLFLRRAPILILDEPTSALDPQAEAEVLAKFQQLSQKRTAIIISHRLSTVKFADQILVLDRGTIAEQGTHDELMQLSGIYAHLFNTQADRYR
ncbi:ABC transporter ATP-binding protein [Roseofilum casamattae]|uniref:ABC transporter ATP-binding protein n=1 Tax=Roseofilum casamattae BLCC-M143 TaxID=3022442 RepID=A0ABT7BYQ6_9CYAN|nr:ABC transporter ATP-binding protein [Roseofilum casamattae]MDJ1183922.1 ABC transporter ATP-binding protein [Roseofilum casamattae BLCC-M143]